jgi:hypothetical protein
MFKSKTSAVIALCTALSGTMVACGGSGGGGGSSSVTPVTPANVMIEPGGQIPAPNGAVTSTQVFVHNYGNTVAQNITYGVEDTNSSSLKSLFANSTTVKSLFKFLGINSGDNLVSSNGFVIDKSSAQRCATISPNSSCAINISTTPVNPGDKHTQTIYLTQAGVKKKQVVNWYNYPMGINTAVNFSNKTPNLAMQANHQGYITEYLIGDGPSGTIYKDVNFIFNPSNTLRITGGFLPGLELASGQVTSIEFASNFNSNGSLNVGIIPTSTVKSTPQGKAKLQFNTTNVHGSALSLGIIPITQANVIMSNPTVLTAASPSQTLTILNSGNESGLLTIGISSNFHNSGTGTCVSDTTNLAPGASCTFIYSVNLQAEGKFESGQLTVSLTTNNAQAVVSNIISTLIYINDYNIALLTLVPSSSSITMVPNETTPLSYVLTNIGSITADNLESISVATGGTTYAGTGGTCPALINLAGNNTSCTFSGVVTAAGSAENSQLAQIENATYGPVLQGNTTSAAAYTNINVSNMPILTFSSSSDASSTLDLATIPADGVESAIGTFRITNTASGSLPAVIDSESYTLPASGTQSIPIDNCQAGTVLHVNESCVVTFKSGPTDESQSEDSNYTYTLHYHGQGDVTPIESSSTGTINYQIIAKDTFLTIESVVASTPFVGSGTSLQPESMLSSESVTATPSLTITYKNGSATYSMTHLNLATSSINPIWAVSGSSTCGTGASETTLDPGEECTLVLNLNRSYIYSESSSVSSAVNVVFPTATWQESGPSATAGVVTQNGMTFPTVDGSNTYYVNYNNTILSSTFAVSGGGTIESISHTGSLTLSQTLTNAPTYDIPVKISTLSTFNPSAITIRDNFCTAQSDGSVTCPNFNSTNSSESITYDFNAAATINQTLTTPITFTLNGSIGQATLGFSPSYAILTMESGL